jgi:hypothetical protein
MPVHAGVIMTKEVEYYDNKKPGKTYISKSLAFSDQSDRRIRIASKVFDSPATHAFVSEHGERVIRVTPGARQEIVAKFYEDNRGVFVLTIQRFTTRSGRPHKISFSFIDEEIPRLVEFISNLRLVHFPNEQRVNVTDEELKALLLSDDQVKQLIVQNQELVLQLARSEITDSDLVALGYRKKQLARFDKLLHDLDYLEQERRTLELTEEALWQQFFERNKWVFGYGLTYVFLSSLDDRKLEQVVVGHDLWGRGKRADAVMKSRGAIEALCFVEIKRHTTELLQRAPYRSGCWSPSDELSGGVAQLQGTVEKAVRKLAEKLEPVDDLGGPTGEALFAYQPRSFLVVGCLNEFRGQHGINTEKYRSFELYRRNTQRPEIITFDELYERARFIVENVER